MVDERASRRRRGIRLPLLFSLVLAGPREIWRTPEDGTPGQRRCGLPRPVSRDLRHLRGHRADPAAGDLPGDLGPAHRVALTCGNGQIGWLCSVGSATAPIGRPPPVFLYVSASEMQLGPPAQRCSDLLATRVAGRGRPDAVRRAASCRRGGRTLAAEAPRLADEVADEKVGDLIGEEANPVATTPGTTLTRWRASRSKRGRYPTHAVQHAQSPARAI